MHPDERGVFTEIYRREWDTGVDPVQWNVVQSVAGTIRGVHVHPRHWDYFVVVSGSGTVGLRDLRVGSPTEGLAAAIAVDAAQVTAVTIPPGVAHGFLFDTDSISIYAVSEYWKTDDELGCVWDDPALEIAWPFSAGVISERDARAGSLSDLLAQLAPSQPIGQSDL